MQTKESVESILESLNDAQKRAVQKIDGPLLILAGAGSGKTKTITSRLAYLISLGIDPANILTLTFTNKAAQEMRERALAMIQGSITQPLLCTFHKFGLLFLKFHIERLGRKNNFIVIDTDDRKKIINGLSKQLPSGLIASEISKYKNSLIEPQEALQKAQMPNYKHIAQVYESYQNYLTNNNLVDFDDLLALSYRLLLEDDELRLQTSQRYWYIMIDEYQDTNELQYKLVSLLCSKHNNICVVGDDDQSIYGWRGANIRNILDFPKLFKETEIIKLETNYRSTKPILQAANALIDHNRNRLGKNLKSAIGDGKEIEVFESRDENEEASKIAKRVKELLKEGVDARQIAILFRINALSRSIEEGLGRNLIAYQLVGGMRFYERTEIKDIISYLRLIANQNDDFSLKRIINRPKRGIGKATLDKIEKEAYEHKCSIFDFMQNCSKKELESLTSKKNAQVLEEFVQTVITLQERAQNSLYRLIDEIESTLLLKEYYNDDSERIQNIDEFYGYFRDYVKQNPENSLNDFLGELSLQSDQDQIDGERICLMSIHASKGLEFSHVFVIGMEEGFFPLLGEGSDIEEERRLGYVAITRAKRELVLSFAHSRFYKGRRTDLKKSRFLSEAGLSGGSLVIEKSTALKKGDLVKHKIFGMGRVTGISKAGREFKLQINFGGTTRDILASFVEKI